MRAPQTFIRAYLTLARSIAPDEAPCSSASAITQLALTELALSALSQYLPGESTDILPALMMGYPALLPEGSQNPQIRQVLASLRHLCLRFNAVPQWAAACEAHAAYPAILRCHDILDERPVPRAAASPALRQLLTETLLQPVPWRMRTVRPATSGQLWEAPQRGQASIAAYELPSFQPPAPPAQHTLSPRPIRAPIRVSRAEMQATAEQIDAREAAPDWPGWLAPLHLTRRLENSVRIEAMHPSRFDGDTLTLVGATHLVGMLSSGKSTLVMALLLTLARRSPAPRIAILVSDTQQGNLLAQRLKHHGISSSLLSSSRNQERYQEALITRQIRPPHPARLSSLASTQDQFRTACSLSHWKIHDDMAPCHDDRGAAISPPPCHRLTLPRQPGRSRLRSNSHHDTWHACPLWPTCPRQTEHRNAVDAQVIILTPQALAHLKPDPWTLPEHASLPELLQFVTDLVIVDEADSVQQILDDTFCPVLPVMGGQGNSFLLDIHRQLHEAMRQHGGSHCRIPVVARWHKKFNHFQNLMTDFYGLLQEEADTLRQTIRNRPITALNILVSRLHQATFSRAGSLASPETEEQQFLQLLEAVSAISNPRPPGDRSGKPSPRVDPACMAPFKELSPAFSLLGQQLLHAEHYRDVLQDIKNKLMTTTQLAPFSRLNDDDKARLAEPAPQDAAWQRAQQQCHEDAVHILLALITERATRHLDQLINRLPDVAQELALSETELGGQLSRQLSQHYRSLLPSSPAGSIFGWLYDEPDMNTGRPQGGTLSAIQHLGVGRHLLNHCHDLLAHEGRPGPHVLMLSGTSWAGGTQGQHNTVRAEDTASPCFDLQHPVHGVLKQPDDELIAIEQSRCALIDIRDQNGIQIRLSGTRETEKRHNLEFIARQLLTPRDGLNRLARIREQLLRMWPQGSLDDRGRCLLVVNAYADAHHLASHLSTLAAQHPGLGQGRICYLISDNSPDEGLPSRTQAIPVRRSQVEQFGLEPEDSILIAPIQVIARGHNILNRQGKAAISQIHFLHRPHPRPDDMGPTIGRMNRYAQACYNQGLQTDDASLTLTQRTRLMRQRARSIVRRSLEQRGGYQLLSPLYQAQFAWDTIIPLWQTIGRGIRGGCPVFVGFIDRQFAPLSFEWHEGAPPDTGSSSVLVQAIQVLANAMDSAQRPHDHTIAQRLYGPLLKALRRTEGLKHDLH